MPYKISWLVPDHLINVVLIDAATPEESTEITNALYEMVTNAPGDHLKHIILNASTSTLAGSVSQYMTTPFKRGEKAGWIVVIGNSKIARFICSLFSKTLQIPFQYVSTHEEALTFLRQRDTAIDNYLSMHTDTIEIDTSQIRSVESD